MNPEERAAARAETDRCMPRYTPVKLIDDSPEGEGQRIALVTDDGREICVPNFPYEWWVDADGNILPLVVSTNRDPGEFENNYAVVVKRDKIASGWFPYDGPYLVEGGSRVATLDERDAEIARRRAAAKVRGSFSERLAQDPAQLAAIKTGEAFERVLNGLVERLQPAAPDPKKK